MYEHILVPLPNEIPGDRLFDHAKHIAKLDDAKVSLLHVIELKLEGGMSLGRQSVVDNLKEESRSMLSDYKEVFSREGIPVSFSVKMGINPGDRILSFARENDMDLIIMGTAGRTGVSRWFLGSTTERVLRGAEDIPTLVVPFESDS